MSNANLHQKWCKMKQAKVVFKNNQELSDFVLKQLKEHYKSNVYKKVSSDLELNLYNVRNWFQKAKGLSAFELLRIMDNYYFIRLSLGYYKVTSNDVITGKKNRKEIRQKILEMLLQNPKMTMQELAEKLETTPKSIEWYINQLVKEKKIVRLGATKKGIWLVSPDYGEADE